MREDVLQLIAQYLHGNYPELSTKDLTGSLENDFSNQKLKEFILEGRWNDLLGRIEMFKGLEPVKFKIIEQMIHETMREGKQTEAFELLRNILSPMEIYPERIHKLAQGILLMQSDPKDRADLYEELFLDLKGVRGFMISENRLEELFDQAKKYQEMNCPYHIKSSKNDSIWYDHQCSQQAVCVLLSENVNRKKIELFQGFSGDLLTLLTTPEYSSFSCINEDGKIAIYHRQDSHWIPLTEVVSINEEEPLIIWPKALRKMPVVNVLVSVEIYEKIPLILEQIFLENMMAIAFMPENDQNYAIISTEKQITVYYDIRSNRIIHSWVRLRCSHLLTPKSLDEKYFLAVSDNNNVLQISTETFEVMKTIPAMEENSQISSAYLDGKRLLLGYNNSTIYYYEDWENYVYPTRIFRSHKCTKYRVNSILSRFDENILLSCSEDGSVYVWNIQSGRLIYKINVHTEGNCVNDILEIDCKTFVTCADDCELYEWTLPS